MVQHVYDITTALLGKQEDTLVVIDDSIVRGTTLKESIIRMLARLHPRKLLSFPLPRKYAIPIVMELI